MELYSKEIGFVERIVSKKILREGQRLNRQSGYLHLPVTSWYVQGLALPPLTPAQIIDLHIFKYLIHFPVVMYGCESWTIEKAEC